jgi:hypothetical protein
MIDAFGASPGRGPAAMACLSKTRGICAAREAMNHRGPALVNIVLSQGSARTAGTRKPLRRHARKAASDGAAFLVREPIRGFSRSRKPVYVLGITNRETNT